MAALCIPTLFGEVYYVTDSEIVHLLGNYIGYGGAELQKQAEKELCVNKLNTQFDIFYKDIKRVLYDNFKVKEKIDACDDVELANKIIGYLGGDDDNFYRNSLIAIVKILEKVKDEIIKDRNIFSGEATFLHLLLLHIEEFVGEIATLKEGKDYNHIKSRKRLLAQEVFDLARRLPRMQTYTNEMTPMYESIFLIRQAIELKVTESLCIGTVINKKYERPIKISPDIFIELLNDKSVKLQNINGEEKTLNINFIRKAHSWTNLFVHSGNGYWFWEVEFVRTALQDFILGNIVIEKAYLEQIPDKILQCVREEEREEAEVIMAKKYYQLIE